MNGRQIPFGVSSHPVAQFLAMIVTGVLLVGAFVMGAFLLVALLGLVAIGVLVFSIRAWWYRRSSGRGPSSGAAGARPTDEVRYIEAEYEIVETDADAERRPPDSRA